MGRGAEVVFCVHGDVLGKLGVDFRAGAADVQRGEEANDPCSEFAHAISYSVRSASVGLMEAARRAGIKQASRAIQHRNAAEAA